MRADEARALATKAQGAMDANITPLLAYLLSEIRKHAANGKGEVRFRFDDLEPRTGPKQRDAVLAELTALGYSVGARPPDAPGDMHLGPLTSVKWQAD